MRKRFSYRELSQLYSRFQFHISVFILSVLGIWLLWEIFREPVVPGWLLYALMVWAALLVIELIRFMYVFHNRSRDKKNESNTKE